MEYGTLGNHGPSISVLGLGTWVGFDRVSADTHARYEAAIAGGINFIDTADVYAGGAAERTLGELLAGCNRESLVVASKLFNPTGDGRDSRGLSRPYILRAIDASLRRLNTDYIDLYQCHRHDPTVPAEEIVQTMGDLMVEGKIRHWGISMWPVPAIEEAVDAAHRLQLPAPVGNQIAYSLLERRAEVDVIPSTQQLGIGSVAFSPLARGALTDRYLEPSDSGAPSRPATARPPESYLSRPVLGRIIEMARLATDLDFSVAQLALAWAINSPGICSAVFGATQVLHVEEGVEACRSLLPPEVLASLDDLFPPGSGTRVPASVDPSELGPSRMVENNTRGDSGPDRTIP